MSASAPTPSCHQRLAALGALADEALDTVEGALLLAQWMEPTLNLAPYRRHIETLIAETRTYVAGDTGDADLALEAARQIVARRFGYYLQTDPAERADGANLARAVDRRRANGVLLCILYAHILQALDCDAEMVDFPARPLIRVHTRVGHVLADPGQELRLLDARDLRRLLKEHHGERMELSPGQIGAFSPRAALLALQHDIKAHHLRANAPEAALQALEGAVLIAPQNANLWRELGLLHERLDHLLDAVNALERFLALPSNDVHRYTASQLLQSLKTRIDQGDA